MKLLKVLLLVLISFSLLLSSCTSRKKSLYFQQIDQDSSVVYKSFNDAHLITSSDVLYVNFYSFDKSLTEMFTRSNSTSSYSMWNSEANVYVNGFSVSDSGFVELPMIGKVFVKGNTINQVKKKIQDKAKLYIKDITVLVKLLNFRFTVVGEVNRPGTYTNYNNDLNIFQALSKAGDASIYGNKTITKLIRETPEGKKIIEFDLTDINILNSEAYYIRPNDIIYIEPMKDKEFKQNLPYLSVLFSSITTLILILNYIER